MSNSRTVLFLDHTAKLGGGEIALLSLAKGLNGSGFKPIVLLASSGPLADRLVSAGVETHIMPLSEAVVETRKGGLGLRSLLQLKQVTELFSYAGRLARFARENDVDLIHTNSLKSDIYGAVAGRLARVPVIWHIRDHVNAEYLPSVVAKVFRSLARLVPEGVIANSQSTLDLLSLPSGKIQGIVYSGVDDSLVAASRPTRIKPDAAVVSLVGRIAEWKGQHIFLHAAAETLKRYPATLFQIVGSPLFGEFEYETELHALVDQLGIGAQVKFLGFRNDVPEIIEKSDLLVHASCLGEPFGQVVVQGMAAAKPVVATNGGALPEIVIPGITGFLVPMRDSHAMAASICDLLSDPDRAYDMGIAGRQRVLEKFTMTKSLKDLATLYEQVLNTGKRKLRSNSQSLQRQGAL